MTIRVLIADDYPIVRAGARGELAKQANIEVIGEAVDGDEAAQQAERLQPDVLLLDISMPGLCAAEVIRRVRALPQPVCVLILTAYGDIHNVCQMLEAGATGYLLKDEAPEVIAEAVRAVAQGQTWLSDEVAQTLARHVVEDTERPACPKLSDREVEVLRLMVKGETNPQIGEALRISERTVRFHLRSIYDKIDVNSRAEAAVWAAKHGLDEALQS